MPLFLYVSPTNARISSPTDADHAPAMLHPSQSMRMRRYQELGVKAYKLDRDGEAEVQVQDQVFVGLVVGLSP
jgi:hypothetical protein